MDYSVVFSGRLCDGADPQLVRETASHRLRLTDPARLERFFSGEPIVIKKGLTREEALQYQGHLLRMGLVTARHRAVAGPSEPTPAPVAPAMPTPGVVAQPSLALAGMHRPFDASPESEPQFGRLNGLKLAPLDDMAEDEPEPEPASPAMLLPPALPDAESDMMVVPPPDMAPASAPTALSPTSLASPGLAALSLSSGDDGLVIAPEPSLAEAMPGQAFAALAARTGTSATPPPRPAPSVPKPHLLPVTDAPGEADVDQSVTPQVIHDDDRWNPDSMPDEAKGLCWGGFFVPFIWGQFNGFQLAGLALLPLVAFKLMLRFVPFPALLLLDFALSVVVLFTGRAYAWRNKAWRNVRHFNETQRTWAVMGFFIALVFWGLVASIVSIHHQVIPEPDAAEQTQTTDVQQAMASEVAHERQLPAAPAPD